MPNVRAGRMPGIINDLEVGEGATVATVLELAGLNADGFEVRLDGVETALTTPVREGQTVLLVRKVKGNLVVRAFRAVRKHLNI